MVQVPPGTVILLQQKWRLKNQIDSGGFATVYSAQSEESISAVAKLVPQIPGAERELLFVELDGVSNVVPIIDRGEWGGYLVLVMPRAKKSLRNHLGQMGSPITADDAVPILIQIARALVTIEGRGIVHRDIKPDNVLLLENTWCIADFGIARYAEATTAPDTRKYAMTKAYAAPEQWRAERATSATDIYSFGVLAYELLAGRCPFLGPDYRRQHLEDLVDRIAGVPPWLNSLVTECMYKSPDARPVPSRVLTRLQSSVQAEFPAAAQLQEANAAAVQRVAEEERQLSMTRIARERTRELLESAKHSVQRILADLDQQIKDNAPSVVISGDTLPLEWSLNDATMRVDEVITERIEARDMPFEVVAYTNIGVRVPQDRIGYSGRSHSLWYCDAQQPGEYRWYETAFMRILGSAMNVEPFQLAPTDPNAHFALTPVTHTYQVAWPFTPFDQGDEPQFVARWMGWFAAGAQGQLQRPSPMPESPPQGSWRR